MSKLRNFSIVLLITLLTFFKGHGLHSERMKNFFPVSVWYGGGKVRAPIVVKVEEKSLEIWKKDLTQIKNLGFNSIRCWIEWATSEKEEGRFDFNSLKKLLDLAHEAGGYGLVETDGKLTERTVLAGKVAKVINENMKLFLKSHPQKAEIAILYNPLSHMVGGQQTYTLEGKPIGYNTLSESLQGIHSTFYENNIPVDFLHSMDLFSERLKEYKLLIVPYPVMMSQSHIQKIIEYVEEGGTLVAEARIGWIDEKGFSTGIIPGDGLDKIFGCRESTLIPLKKTSSIIIKSSHESLPFLKEGEKLDSLFLEESFEITNKNAKVLAEFEDGKPAIIYSNYGKGKALIVGSFIGLAYHHFSNPNNKKFFAGLVKWVGIKKYIDVVSSEDVFLEGKILEGKDFKVLFAFNRGDKKTSAQFEILVDDKDYVAKEIETNKKIPVIQKGNKIIFSRGMEPNEVWVVAIEKNK